MTGDERREIRVVAAAIIRDRMLFVARRRAGLQLEGCWELPGGKVEPGEDDRQALFRELQEELSVDVRVGERMCESAHDYPWARVRLVAYRCVLVAGEPVARVHDALDWVDRRAMVGLHWAPADVPLLEAIGEVLA